MVLRHIQVEKLAELFNSHPASLDLCLLAIASRELETTRSLLQFLSNCNAMSRHGVIAMLDENIYNAEFYVSLLC